jgi:hypothetical protein
MLRLWTNQCQAGYNATLGEICSFGEKSILGVDGIATRPLGGSNNSIDIQVRRRPNTRQNFRVSGKRRVQAGPVIFRMNRNRAQTQV